MTLVQEIIDYCVLDYAENMSNHRPVKLNLSVSVGKLISIPPKENVSAQRIAWHKVLANPALVEDYHQNLQSLLSIDSFDEIRSCCDVNCNNSVHKKRIDQWCKHIAKAV